LPAPDEPTTATVDPGWTSYSTEDRPSAVEQIVLRRGATISASATPSPSKNLISFVVTTRVDRVRRDRNTKLLADSFHLSGSDMAAQRDSS